MLTTTHPSLSTKSSMEDFWNLESIGITDLLYHHKVMNVHLRTFSKAVAFADGHLAMEREYF